MGFIQTLAVSYIYIYIYIHIHIWTDMAKTTLVYQNLWPLGLTLRSSWCLQL